MRHVPLAAYYGPPLPNALARGRPGGGGGRGAWGPALGVGVRQGCTPGRWPVPPSCRPFGAWPTGRPAVVLAFSHGPPAAGVAAAASVLRGARGPGQGQLSVVSGSEGLHCRTRPRAPRCRRAPTWPCPRPLARSCRGLQVRGLRLSSICPTARTAGGGGAQGRGAWACGGAPQAVGPLPPPVLSVWRPRLGLLGVGPLPSGLPVICASFAWGLGLRRWRVPRAVAPVAEGDAQGLVQPDIGLRVRDADPSSPSFQERQPLRPPVGPLHSNHGPEDPFVVFPSHQTPRRYFPVLPVPPEEHGIKGPVPPPPGGL